MSSYPRTPEGHVLAVKSCQSLNRMHGKDYALLVDVRSPDKYSVGLASLVHEQHVEPGTTANIIDKNGNFTPLFVKDLE